MENTLAVVVNAARTGSSIPGEDGDALGKSMGLPSARPRNMLDAPNDDGLTPIMLAAHANRTEIVRMLLKHGVRPDLARKDWLTALHGAAQKGSESVVKALAQCGSVHVDARNLFDMTPLHIAVNLNRIDIAKLLLQYSSSGAHSKAAICRLRSKNRALHTPLVTAVMKQDAEMVTALLEYPNIEPNLADDEGKTLLHTIDHVPADSKVLNELLKRNIFPLDTADKSGSTPLAIAACKGELTLVKALLDTKVVRVEPLDNRGMTPLMHAIACSNYHLKQRRIEVVEALLATKQVNVNHHLEMNNDGKRGTWCQKISPLCSAALERHSSDQSEAIYTLLRVYGEEKGQIEPGIWK